MIEVFIPVVEAELTLLQVQIESRATHPLELDESRLRHAPEAFDAVDVTCAAHELIAVMTDSVVLLVAHVDDAVVRAKAVCMNRRRQLDFAANNGLQTGFFAVRHDLGINAPIALVDAEDDGLAACAASALATHAARPEVRFVEFDLSAEGRLALAVLSDGLADQAQITVDRVAIQPGQRSDLRGGQIQCKELENLPKFSTRNSCANKLLRTNCHDLV